MQSNRLNIRLNIFTAALLCSGAFWFSASPAQALPNHPDKCPEQMPEGGFSCLSSGGKVICTNDGDVMCCKPNPQGGQDCEQIVSFTGPKGGLRIQGGPVVNAPVTTAPSNASRFPKAGMNAPIMRRGVEGEQSDSPPTPSEAPAESK